MSGFVPFVSDEEIAAIGSGLVARTLPKAQWTHAAHFAATLWLMDGGEVPVDGDLVSHPSGARMGHPRHPRSLEEVAGMLPGLIRAYNEVTGTVNSDTSGYHETITRVSLRAARAFREERAGVALFAVVNELMASRLGRSDWVLTYWSRERLFSVEARRGWVEPDLEELPW